MEWIVLFVFLILGFAPVAKFLWRKPKTNLVEINERLITRTARLAIVCRNIQQSWNEMVVSCARAAAFAPMELQVPMGASVSACAEDLKDMLLTQAQMCMDVGSFVEASLTDKAPKVVDLE